MTFLEAIAHAEATGDLIRPVKDGEFISNRWMRIQDGNLSYVFTDRPIDEWTFIAPAMWTVDRYTGEWESTPCPPGRRGRRRK